MKEISIYQKVTFDQLINFINYLIGINNNINLVIKDLNSDYFLMVGFKNQIKVVGINAEN